MPLVHSAHTLAKVKNAAMADADDRRAAGPADRRGAGGGRGGPADRQHRRRGAPIWSTCTAPTRTGSTWSRPGSTPTCSGPATARPPGAHWASARTSGHRVRRPDPAAQGPGRAAPGGAPARRPVPGPAVAAWSSSAARPAPGASPRAPAGRAGRRLGMRDRRLPAADAGGASWCRHLPGGRRGRRAQLQRVLRSGRARGAGVRDAVVAAAVGGLTVAVADGRQRAAGATATIPSVGDVPGGGRCSTRPTGPAGGRCPAARRPVLLGCDGGRPAGELPGRPATHVPGPLPDRPSGSTPTASAASGHRPMTPTTSRPH